MRVRWMMVTMFFAVSLVYSLEAWGTAQVTGRMETTIQPRRLPSVIWVADFDIDVADIREEKGILGGEGPLQRGGPRGGGILGRHQSPESTAGKLVDLLASSLTQDLQNKSLPARRLAPDQPLPTKGWLIRGQFMEVDEGNRLRRAIVGFGAGATHMQIEVTVADRENHPDQPFLLMGTDAQTGKMPGAVVTMNPYVAAAKFVMAKNASEKDVKATAEQIASEIVNYLKQHGLLRP